MCDFISWIEVGKKPRIKRYWLEDDMIEAKWPNANFEDKIGHSAILDYFGEEVQNGERYESFDKIPREIAVRVNAGKMRKMAVAGGYSADIRFNTLNGILSKNDRIKEEEKRRAEIEKAFDEAGFKIARKTNTSWASRVYDMKHA